MKVASGRRVWRRRAYDKIFPKHDMVIAKTASRSVAFKTIIMSQAVLEAQASFVTQENVKNAYDNASKYSWLISLFPTMAQEASSARNSLDDDDVERNADLYVFNHEVAHD